MNKKEFREIFKKFDRIKRDSWPGRLWIEVIFFGETNFFARTNDGDEVSAKYVKTTEGVWEKYNSKTTWLWRYRDKENNWHTTTKYLTVGEAQSELNDVAYREKIESPGLSPIEVNDD